MKEGYWRLPEVEAMTDLSETAKETLDIPIGAKLVKLTVTSGGAVVVSYAFPATEKQKAERREKFERAMAHSRERMIERLHTEPKYRGNLEKLLELYENGDLQSGNFDNNSQLFRELAGYYD